MRTMCHQIWNRNKEMKLFLITEIEILVLKRKINKIECLISGSIADRSWQKKKNQ